MTGPELKAWREHWMFSQAQLASALDVHPYTVGRWERDQSDIPGVVPLALETLARRRAKDLQQRAARTA